MAKLNCSVCGYGMARGATSCAHCRRKAKKIAEEARLRLLEIRTRSGRT
jgi:bacterioferritin-associated ferredoxin